MPRSEHCPCHLDEQERVPACEPLCAPVSSLIEREETRTYLTELNEFMYTEHSWHNWHTSGKCECHKCD